MTESIHRHMRALLIAVLFGSLGTATGQAASPSPLIAADRPAQWMFVYKLNAAAFPGCKNQQARSCTFGGTGASHTRYGTDANPDFGLQYVFASDSSPALTEGDGCLGEATSDPIGATFSQIYNGGLHYVVWNDQFYSDPPIPASTGFGACISKPGSNGKMSSGNCDKPWGHSKGILAWDDQGEGVLLQVSTPSWPAAGSSTHPRAMGNTLGCVDNDNDVRVAQHFFSLKLSKADTLEVLRALGTAAVATDPANPQVVNNGGPDEIVHAVERLGSPVKGTAATHAHLGNGAVDLIAKPPGLLVAPWQLASAELGGIDLLAATWWTPNNDPLPDTEVNSADKIECWDYQRYPRVGAVKIAKQGHLGARQFSLTQPINESGNPAPTGKDGSHAKVGVSLSGTNNYVVFSDLNQDGALARDPTKGCRPSQNSRGGLFFVIDNKTLHDSLKSLISP